MSGENISAGRDVILAGAGAVINRNRGPLLAIAIGLVLIGTGIGFLVYHSESSRLDAPRIRAHLVESSERKRNEDLASAGAAKTSIERERLRDAAEKADAARKARIADLVDSFVALDAKTETTSIFREMTRILSEEGVDAALAYVAKERDVVLRSIQARVEGEHRQNRADLQPFLKAAGLQSAKGQIDVARNSYRYLLSLEPGWPDALEAYAWFLIGQPTSDRTISAAFSDVQEALNNAKLLLAQDETEPRSRRLFAAASDRYADILSLRNLPGDADHAFEYYGQSLNVREKLLKDDPKSAQAARDVTISLDGLGDFLVARGQLGDAAHALEDYTRSLKICEALLQDNPKSAQAARDVSVCLDNLGDFLAARGQPGDADQALRHYSRSLDICESLVKANPESVQADRDVSVSLNNLGDILVARGQPGDADQALKYRMRSLAICERRLTANPDSPRAERDVSVCLDRLADSLLARGRPGDADQALKYRTRSLQICDGLLKANPESVQAARDVSVSLDNLGDFLAARGQPGDPEQALKYHSRSLEICESLLKVDPESAQAARDVSVSLDDLADSLVARGQPGDDDQALKHYTRSLEICESLLKRNPKSAQAARDVSESLNSLGDFFAAHGRPNEAKEYRQRANEMLAKIKAGGVQLPSATQPSVGTTGIPVRQP